MDRRRMMRAKDGILHIVARMENVAMLVLSRHKNEEILIGDNIRIVVIEIRGEKVRIGIEAPKDVPVHRREVYEAIANSKQQSE